ncbi:MAG: 50S ribosomal protein L31 [Candidatus Carsonella ruddii]
MNKILFKCICNEKYYLFSSFKKNIEINICINCHNFYNKKKKIINSTRSKRFFNKYDFLFKK